MQDRFIRRGATCFALVCVFVRLFAFFMVWVRSYVSSGFPEGRMGLPQKERSLM
ncbi:hypothetical protein PJE062_4984 [Pseudovibrio sp. JE062]|nr:hypothetical protein PJE062_4984 [Pseudovibrio sp. JE062]